MARGRDLMRFYCSDDVTGGIVQAVVERKTFDSIYRVWTTRFGESNCVASVLILKNDEETCS